MTQHPPSSPADEPAIAADSEYRGVVAVLPLALRPYFLLARFDRPIGWWLLFWPGAWGVALAGQAAAQWPLLAWLLLGSVAMRGAGCVYNDIVDRDLDARVARTANRPLASGQVSVRAAALWLVALCLIGLLVLLQLPLTAQLVALASLVLVAAYPFMKRVTWWPQAWLGLVFSWAAPVGWLAAGGEAGAALLFLYLGSVLWVVGYDTIYALQDIEDDALAGIKSSARALGSRVRGGIAACYAGALGGWALAIWAVRPDPLALAALVPAAIHLTGQIVTLSPADADNALARFRSNRFAGLLVFAAMVVVGTTAY